MENRHQRSEIESVSYCDAVELLYGLRRFGLKLGLHNTFTLAALVGNPQDKLCFIRVAGTNGKGSTCAMFESIFRAAGLRVWGFSNWRTRLRNGRASCTVWRTGKRAD